MGEKRFLLQRHSVKAETEARKGEIIFFYLDTNSVGPEVDKESELKNLFSIFHFSFFFFFTWSCRSWVSWWRWRLSWIRLKKNEILKILLLFFASLIVPCHIVRSWRRPVEQHKPKIKN